MQIYIANIMPALRFYIKIPKGPEFARVYLFLNFFSTTNSGYFFHFEKKYIIYYHNCTTFTIIKQLYLIKLEC